MDADEVLGDDTGVPNSEGEEATRVRARHAFWANSNKWAMALNEASRMSGFVVVDASFSSCSLLNLLAACTEREDTDGIRTNQRKHASLYKRILRIIITKNGSKRFL